MQQPAIEACKKRGYSTIVADQNPAARCTHLGDLFVPIKGNDPDQLTEALSPYRGRFHGCFTLGTDMALFVGAINDEFQLKGITRKQGDIMTHKGKMRQFFTDHGLLQPPWLCSSSKMEVSDWMINHPFEAYVIKPVRNMGARGIMYLQSPRDLSFAFEYAINYSRENEVIIEPYIRGHEFSIDTLTWEQKTYSTGFADRIIEIKDGRFFIETGHTMPSAYHEEVHKSVTLEMAKIAKALSQIGDTPFFGALKGDVRLSESCEIVVGEAAARLSGGFMSTHTYPLATGCDLIEASLDMLEGKTPYMLQKGKHQKYHSVVIERAIVAPPGKLSDITSPEKSDPLKNGLIEWIENFREGDIIPTLQNNVGKLANAIVRAPSLGEAENIWQKVRESVRFSVTTPDISDSDIRTIARKRFRKDVCRACLVCDGVECSSGVPGMGGTGDMKGFCESVRLLNDISINTVTTPAEPSEKTVKPGIDFNFLGQSFAAPLMIAPVTGARTNLGGAITEYDYVMETGAAGDLLNLAVMYGDGATPDKYHVGLEAIRHFGGGFLVVKPLENQEEIITRVQAAEKAGAGGWGMDIDSVGIATMEARGRKTVHKSAADLREIASSSKLPFFIKGISDIAAAELAISAGASAIMVGNHGGRVDSNTPPAVKTIPDIAAHVKKNFPHISVIADGGIRSGAAMFKMIALGAGAVSVARPVAIATVAYGRLGARALLARYITGLTNLMQERNLRSVKEICREHLAM